MAAADSEEGGQQGETRQKYITTRAEMPRLPQEVYKQTLDDWKDSAAEYDVQAELFDKKQFVTDEELVMGGSNQKLACAYINICVGERIRREVRSQSETPFAESGKLLRIP
jgi:hypothetical protein